LNSSSYWLADWATGDDMADLPIVVITEDGLQMFVFEVQTDGCHVAPHLKNLVVRLIYAK
jgi:hypothetical protein